MTDSRIMHGLAASGLAWLALAALAMGAEEPRFALPPPGPYAGRPAEFYDAAVRFTHGQKLVVTPYFYWYDTPSRAHVVDPDGSDALTDHPPTLEGFSYRSADWHRTQLADMTEAGIDVVLPVYWGEPSERRPGRPMEQQPWSFAGLPPLVEARERLLAQGLKPPAIGLFYDTSTLQHNRAGYHADLTQPGGRRWFADCVRDFFSLLPPKHWATIDGRPLVFLYSADFAAGHDTNWHGNLAADFAADFGGRRPYVVREVSWKPPADGVYAWGGALGYKNPGVASLGPGYDHSAVDGRPPLVAPREDGAFYARNWVRFLRDPSPIVFLETWNEFHEGTDIAESREYGRKYIELTKTYVDFFRRGVVPPWPVGPYTGAARVEARLGPTNEAKGLLLLDAPDGHSRPATVGGVACRLAVRGDTGGSYLYFRLHDSFRTNAAMNAEVEVEYHDAGKGHFGIQYDGPDPTAPNDGAYSACAQTIRLGGTEEWKTARFPLPRARFEGRQNGGADFRLAVNAEPLAIRAVRVFRTP